MKISTVSQKQTNEIQREYRFIKINDVYGVFKVIEKTVKTFLDSKPNSKAHLKNEVIDLNEVQGLCFIKEYKSAVKDWSIPKVERALLLSKEHLDLFAQYGFTAFQNIDGNLGCNALFSDGKGKLVEKEFPDFNPESYSVDPLIDYKNCEHEFIFDVVSESPELLESIYLLDYSKYYISDLNGVYQPLGLRYNYTEGKLDNSKFDLDKVTEFLKNRDGVVVIQSGNTMSRLTQDEIIRSVPSYNIDFYNHGFIECFIKPSFDEYQKIMATVNSSKEYLNPFDAAWNCNAFGLNDSAHNPKGSCWDYNETMELSDND